MEAAGIDVLRSDRKADAGIDRTQIRRLGRQEERLSLKRPIDGTSGWDEYAAFYDWENSQTLGRRDVAFWRQLAQKTRGRILELGAGTGRLTIPLAKAAPGRIVGIDRSGPMLERQRLKRARLARGARPALFNGDIRALPFAAGAFRLVIAPYGMLQSLTSDRDLARALREASRVLAPGGVLGVDLVPDLPVWDEYANAVRFRGRGPGGSTIRLIESVRQDRRRRLTIFGQHFIEARRGRTLSEQRFSLAFRSLPIPAMIRRIEACGMTVEHVLGSYRGGPWDDRADTWLLLARRRPPA